MISIIKNKSPKRKYDDLSENENGNNIYHVICAFSKDNLIHSNTKLGKLNNHKNKNGWTPFFYGNLHGTKELQEKLHSYERKTNDYFGNDVPFYLKKD